MYAFRIVHTALVLCHFQSAVSFRQAGSSTSRARSCWLRAHKPKKNMEFTTEDKLSRCYTNRSLCSCTRMTCAHRGVKVSGSGADLWIGPLYIAVA
jgi:hypothetical protein